MAYRPRGGPFAAAQEKRAVEKNWRFGHSCATAAMSLGARCWAMDRWGLQRFSDRRLLLGAAVRVRNAASVLADIIMPPVCVACRRRLEDHDALCAACWSGVQFIRPPLCDRLGLPLPFDIGGRMVSAAAEADPPDYGRARAVARYDGTMRRLIHDLKFNDRHDGRRLFGRWLAEAGRDILRDPEAVLVPVPQSRLGLLRRRFNQAAILAQEVGGVTGHGFAPLMLARTRRTANQVGLTRDQRRTNVRGAFAVPSDQRMGLGGRPVILVDDVMTTGATARACARALLRGGAARVDVLALALVTDGAVYVS